MIICKTAQELKFHLNKAKSAGQKIGFVPTMGALHAGHMSLIDRAKAENALVVVSIFINPTQFNNPTDLEKYPRTPEKDFEMLNNKGVDLVFYPTIEEIYPEGMGQKSSFHFGRLEEIMEGKFRPGHFKGVGQVVLRLFEIVNADNAYFGEKDFQQLAVIRKLVDQKNIPIRIEGCPTVREPDGLAMSSRNLLLTPELRKEATKISKALFFVRDQQKQGAIDEVKKKAIHMIEASGVLKVEYFEIVNEKTLESVAWWQDASALRCLTAVQAGNIRLIDNVQL